MMNGIDTYRKAAKSEISKLGDSTVSSMSSQFLKKEYTDLGMDMEKIQQDYIISSGMREIIKSTSIADEFKRIYACRYYYDETHTATWPAQVVNYTAKTQYIFRINKQVLDVNDDADLNKYVPQTERPIPFERMIYIADGLTDVPCMRLVKEYGGKSIAVYSSNNAVAKSLKDVGRVNYIAKADYSSGSEMEQIVQSILDHMKADEVLKKYEEK